MVETTSMASSRDSLPGYGRDNRKVNGREAVEIAVWLVVEIAW